MKCWSQECLITSCLVLLILTIIQMIFIAFSYGSIINEHNRTSNRRRATAFIRNQTISRRLPTALIIGVRKGGTRALLDAIALHPKIKIARKETHYFNLNYSKGIDWYRSMMPLSKSNEVVIEKTPGYFTSPIAPKRVHELNPTMKIILIVRDPTQRTISDFTQVVYYNKMEQNKTLPIFEKEVFVDESENLNINYKPVRNSLYDLHIANWLRYFSMQQILLVNGDVFRGNPISELRRVETFLGLPHEISPDQLIFNEHKGFFCFRRSPTVRIKCLGDSKGRPHREIAEDVVERLRRHLQPHNRRFFVLVNRIFNW
ncbi:sulfotransferase domain protein [Dictyocaulus viviparus]|uniref:Sulfotransferase domain protein n=1 Tax=Dictyocaulus viviparus TaxID=29172 RepID=A0A0D8Y0D2_DICVI|nr:sulfotransferase domain protein [Dictyocaulus viviparus]